MSRVFYARRITWYDEDGAKCEQFGVPAIVRTSVNCQTRSDRRRMMHTAKQCGVALHPIQFGETMAHGHTVAIAWLALCDGENLEGMEAFLECGLVTWEHCTMHEIPYGMTKLGRQKRPAGKPKKKPALIHPAGPICPETGLPSDLTNKPVYDCYPRIPNAQK